MVNVKVMVIYGNPEVVAMVNALATYCATAEEDSYDQGSLSFEFDSEEKANNLKNGQSA
jgi:hypothetical protein